MISRRDPFGQEKLLGFLQDSKLPPPPHREGYYAPVHSHRWRYKILIIPGKYHQKSVGFPVCYVGLLEFELGWFLVPPFFCIDEGFFAAMKNPSRWKGAILALKRRWTGRGGFEWNSHDWRIIPFSKWLMLASPPTWVIPLPNDFFVAENWGLQATYYITGMILQAGTQHGIWGSSGSLYTPGNTIL